MSDSEPTCIGRVRHVLGATVTVSLNDELAGVTPLWEGRLHAVGQIGSLVRIPQGPVALLASVTLVGIAELSGAPSPGSNVQVGDRWLQVQLLGEIDGLGRFRRGVSRYPGLDDPVHFTTAETLRAVFPAEGADRVRLGVLSSGTDIPLTLDAARLVTRHGAIVGSTGSGKTSAVARLVQGFVKGGWSAANIIIIDPHGEYRAALEESASIRSVLGEGDSQLRVPFWALPSADILRAFCGNVESATIQSRFGELVTEGRREFTQNAAWLRLDPTAVTSDSPIPFDIQKAWFQLDHDNNATFENQGGGGELQIEEVGDAATLKPTRFQTHGLGSQPPFKGPFHGLYGTVPERLRLRLLDPLYRFFLQPKGAPEGPDPLVTALDEWLGGEHPISVLDFSGVPSEVSDLAIGVVLQLIFDVSVRSTASGIGRPRPVLIVLEEAHRYLGESLTTRHARDAANRIAREGRKYGVGLVLVTQRPSELPDTALSQCGTIIALRLTNSSDQATVKAALPDSVSGLADALPSLRTGEAIVSGEAVVLPTRMLIDLPDPPPQASDPSIDSWHGAGAANELDEAVARWRGIPEQEDADA